MVNTLKESLMRLTVTNLTETAETHSNPSIRFMNENNVEISKYFLAHLIADLEAGSKKKGPYTFFLPVSDRDLFENIDLNAVKSCCEEFIKNFTPNVISDNFTLAVKKGDLPICFRPETMGLEFTLSTYL